MFTPSSKYFLGLTGLSLVAAVLYLVLINPSDIGSIALFGIATSSAVIAGFAFFTRDGDAFSDDEAAAAAAHAPSASIWPIVFALSLATVLTGLATVPAVFILGVSALIGAGIEWTIQNWAQRSSDDATFNSFVRERAISGLEYPGLAAVGLAVIAYLFSRIALTVSKDAGAVIFMLVGAAVLAVGVLISVKPALRGRTTVIISVVGVLVLGAGGIGSALSGEREQLTKAAKEDHFSAEHRECGTEKSKYYDKHANNTVSLRSAVSATVFVEDGKLFAREVGLQKNLDTLTVRRANSTTLLFRNLDEEDRRLVINLGSHTNAETGKKEEVGTCTQLTGQNQEQSLTLTIAKPATASEPYSLTVPGITGQIKVVVP